MPKESHIRDDVRILIVRNLAGMVTNHEDKFTKGIGDTSFAITHELTAPHVLGDRVRRLRGWIEFKHDHEWPKRWDTELRLGIRPEQRIWNRQRWRHAQDNFFVMRIASDIYMFTGAHTDELYFPISRKRFESLWIGKWQRKIDPSEFLEILLEHL